jgi:hypothetical protein
MTEADTAAATPEAPPGWTCARCQMTLSWTADAENPELPSTWTHEDDGFYCLACRRDRAGDASVDDLPGDAPLAIRQRTRFQGRIDFEIQRDPDRPDNRIAKACRTSTLAVRKARTRLGLPRPPQV